MFDKHSNFGISNVVSPPSPGTSGNRLSVTSGDGANFPTPPFNATVWQANTLPKSTNAEIVRVTAKSGDVFTISRTQESSTARSIVTGDQIAATITKKTLTDIESAAGDVVGPSSATDNAIARFDGITGKLIQNSTVTVDDNGVTNITSNASAPAGPLLSTVQSNSSFNHYISYIESNQTTTLSNDTLRIVSNGGAVGSRGLYIQQNSDAGAIIIDATGAPQTTIGANLTVFNIDGANTAFSMAKFVNHGISTTNNSNVFIQNVEATTTARTLELNQAGTGAAIYIDTNGTNPAVEVATSKFGVKTTLDINGGYGLNIATDGTHTASPSNGLARIGAITTADTAPVLNIDNRSAGKSLYIQNNGTEKLSVDATGKLVSAANAINVTTTHTPSSASDTGITGDIAWDSSFIYVCIATNTWHRVAHASW